MWNFFNTPIVNTGAKKDMLSPSSAYEFRVRAYITDIGWTSWSASSGPIRTIASTNTNNDAPIAQRLDLEGVDIISKTDIEYDDPRVLLGRGGFGAVYKGRLHNYDVAVKELFSWEYYFNHGIGIADRKHHIEAIRRR